jgi:biotin synthase
MNRILNGHHGVGVSTSSTGGRELTLGDLGTRDGLLGGINAVIVGNYLTTLGRPADADLNLLVELNMPIKEFQKTL